MKVQLKMFGMILHNLEVLQMCRFLSRTSDCFIKRRRFQTTVFSNILINNKYSHSNNFVFYLLEKNNLRSSNLIHKILVLHYATSITPSAGVSLSHMKRILQMKKLDFKDGFTCLTTRCIFCTHEHNGDLFINKVTGYFLCTKCRASGSWNSLENALNKNKIVQPLEELDESLAKWTSISEKSIPFQSLPQDKIQEVMNRFKFKDIYEETLFKLKALMDPKGAYMYIPIYNGKQIVGVKELTPDGKETSVPNTGCKGVILTEASKKKELTEEAIVVQSVKDMLALSCLKLPYDVISLPHGISKLPQEVLPILEHYKKIVLWFGNEDGHWDSARHFAKKLNEQRCNFVRPTDDHPSPYKAQQEGMSLPAILNSAMPVAHKSITNFTYLREDVLSHLQNVEKAAGVKWSRFPALNKVLKGHRRGEMTILTGPSGSGKTTFMSEYSLDLAMQGVTTLWGSFEIRNERLARIMLQQLCQFPLHLHLDKFNMWADIFQQLPIYFMTFFGQQPLKTVMEAVEHAAYVYDISHVIIDNVQFMMGHSANDNSLDRFYRQDAIVGAFRNFATTANCHVTLVIHPRKEKDAEMLSMNSVFGGAKATQEADNVLIIQQKTLPNLKLKKFVQIAKNRYCGDLGVMPLDFNKEALSFLQKS